MSVIEEALVTRLEAVAGVTNLVSTRIYPRMLPQNPTYPALTFHRVSGPRVESTAGSSGLAHPRFQVSAWGETYAAVKDVVEQVRLALQGFAGTVDGIVIAGIAFLGDVDQPYEPDVGVFQVASDYEIWHQEPRP